MSFEIEALQRSGPTGPRTDEGKARCRLNAFRHGLTGQIMVLTPEEQKVYEDHCAALKAAYDPKGAVEEGLVQSIADGRWRLKRAAALENSLFGMALHADASAPTGNPEVDAAFTQARTWLTEGKNIALLTVYENRIRRALEKDILLLEAAQERRLTRYQESMDIARNLYKLAQAQGKAYKPQSYFRVYPQTFESVFSTEAVAHEIHRAQLKFDAEEWAVFHRLPNPEPDFSPESTTAEEAA
jgi:hypothetical protein